MMRFKPKRRSTKARRASKKRDLDARVLQNMRLVRLEDGYCRFPECGCARFIQLEVAHTQHRGAGGNPTGDRSDPAKMILFCKHRHMVGRISIDAGTVDVRPLTDQGTRGPCEYWIDKRALTMSRAQMGAGQPDWVLVAVESRRHVVAWRDDALLAQIREVR